MKNITCITIACMFLWLSCKKEENKPKEENVITTPADTTPVEKIIEISTTFGKMYMWLNKETPLHRTNFFALADTNYFDNSTFHRVIPNFMIQGGDPNSKDANPNNDGQGGPPWTIPAEINTQKFKHDFGAVGAARNNNPTKASSGSQFYIVVNSTGAHHLDGDYTVFGKIFKGMDVATSIVNQPRDANDRPLADVKMDVTVLEKTVKQLKDEYNFVP